MLLLQEFDFTIQHTPGNENAVVDLLSRLEENCQKQGVLYDLSDAALFSLTKEQDDDWYEEMHNTFPQHWLKDKRK